MPLVEKDGFDADGSRDSGQDHMGMDGCIDELVAVAYQPVIGREFSRARAPSHPAMDTFLQVVPKAQLRWWLMPHRIDIYIYSTYKLLAAAVMSYLSHATPSMVIAVSW